MSNLGLRKLREDDLESSKVQYSKMGSLTIQQLHHQRGLLAENEGASPKQRQNMGQNLAHRLLA